MLVKLGNTKPVQAGRGGKNTARGFETHHRASSRHGVIHGKVRLPMVIWGASVKRIVDL
jgi:hypothetical protein